MSSCSSDSKTTRLTPFKLVPGMVISTSTVPEDSSGMNRWLTMTTLSSTSHGAFSSLSMSTADSSYSSPGVSPW